MVSQSSLIFSDLTVIGLELYHLFNKDSLIGETEKERAVELELRGYVESPMHQFKCVLQNFNCEIVLFLKNDAILGVLDVKADR